MRAAAGPPTFSERAHLGDSEHPGSAHGNFGHLRSLLSFATGQTLAQVLKVEPRSP